MKKHRSKHTTQTNYRIINIKKENFEKQLAALGAVGLCGGISRARRIGLVGGLRWAPPG